MNILNKEEAEGLAEHLRGVFPPDCIVEVKLKAFEDSYYVLFKLPPSRALSRKERRLDMITRNNNVRDAIRNYNADKGFTNPVSYWIENIVTLPTGVEE